VTRKYKSIQSKTVVYIHLNPMYVVYYLLFYITVDNYSWKNKKPWRRDI